MTSVHTGGNPLVTSPLSQGVPPSRNFVDKPQAALQFGGDTFEWSNPFEGIDIRDREQLSKLNDTMNTARNFDIEKKRYPGLEPASPQSSKEGLMALAGQLDKAIQGGLEITCFKEGGFGLRGYTVKLSDGESYDVGFGSISPKGKLLEIRSTEEASTPLYLFSHYVTAAPSNKVSISGVKDKQFLSYEKGDRLAPISEPELVRQVNLVAEHLKLGIEKELKKIEEGS